MTNRENLLNTIKFVSWKCNELNEKVEFPHYDTQTRDQWTNACSLHHIHEVAAKITGVCADILTNETDIEEKEELKTELLLSRVYQPYGQTLDIFYDHLLKWREKTTNGECDMASKKKQKCLKNRDILTEVVRDTVLGISRILDEDLAIEPYVSLTERKWSAYAQALRKITEAVSLLDYVVNLEVDVGDLPELENINTSPTSTPSFGNWAYFTRNQLKAWVKANSEDTEIKEEFRYDLDWK